MARNISCKIREILSEDRNSSLLSPSGTVIKEALDYWKCLNRTTRASYGYQVADVIGTVPHSRYVVLLENDALAVPNFPTMMTSLIKQLDDKKDIDYFLADIRYYLTNTVYMSLTESCSTRAMLFRSEKIPELVDQLSRKSRRNACDGHAKHHILDESSFIGRQTDTNFVVHIGETD
ncbi:hypothetical protein DICVIV_01797 [Dictyocaulus viviparus]|uniref:Uncharacterized protein n=1 Tax=Dictyocaulus viviparus TaxID=29172 RepID=A0A0D8YBP4_DICVI|nr:hypothetical protein DICVIV_01797 [Dictyocaulus viviparus]